MTSVSRSTRPDRSRSERRLRFAIAAGATLAVGLVLRSLLRELPETSPWRDPYLLARRTILQLGAFGVLAAGLAYAADASRRLFGWPPVPARGFFAGLLASGLIAFLVGETALRIWFWGGESFADHYGPIVRDFERDMVFNRYDGPSRGPEIDETRTGAWRVVVQGDSITWGQGVRDEADLYSSRLLAGLRAGGAPVEMAVLAKPGREMDGHLEQLRRYGSELRPDLLIYQWYSNDMEVDRTEAAPGLWAPSWRRFLLYPPLVTHSYFFFFLDNRATTLLFGQEQADDYTHYLLDRYTAGRPGWAAFEAVFREWAREAKAVAPRILVVLYSHFGAPGASDDPLRAQVVDLVAGLDIASVDLHGYMAAATDDPPKLLASPFDSHPGAKGHAVIAAAVLANVRERWPELQEPRAAGSPRPEAPGR